LVNIGGDFKKFLHFFLAFVLSAIFLSGTAFSQSWVSSGSVTNPGPQPSITVVNNYAVWIGGGNGDTARIFRTLNGGLNWNIIPTAGMTHEVGCIAAITPDLAYVGEGIVNGNANLFKTTNGGLNWVSVYQTPVNRGFFNGLIFTKANGYIFGLAIAERVYRSSNSGVNWIELNAGANGVSNAHNSLMLVDNNFYGFGLNNGAARVKLTTDNSTNWLTQSVNITGNYTSAIAFHSNKMYGVAATSTSLPTVARTTDGGITWSSVDIGTGISGTCFFNWIENTPVVYIVGSNGTIKRSNNNGLTWVTTPTAGITGISHFDFVNINNIIYGYAVSTNGNVIKLTDSILVLTGIHNNGNLPVEYSLYQNYPNPFNPSTTISFSIAKSGLTKLSVFNYLGQEIAVLKNETMQAGRYEFLFDASNIASGVYYYKLTAGDFTDTKKMILVK
jgi:photosystem II stability/assembly factor-like uncharacterized protein